MAAQGKRIADVLNASASCVLEGFQLLGTLGNEAMTAAIDGFVLWPVPCSHARVKSSC